MTDWTPKATKTIDNGEIYISVTWTGPEELDRPNTFGWTFDDSERGRDLSDRLYRAVNAGKVFVNATKVFDVFGRSYIEAKQTEFFHGKQMNVSLRKIGF